MSEWYQGMLTPPEVVEVRCRIGVIPDADHAQALVEVVDPMTSVQIAQWSSPHVKLSALASLVELTAGKLAEMTYAHIEPF